MKAQNFQALVDQLGDLSQVQREALVEALTATGSGEEVPALPTRSGRRLTAPQSDPAPTRFSEEADKMAGLTNWSPASKNIKGP